MKKLFHLYKNSYNGFALWFYRQKLFDSSIDYKFNISFAIYFQLKWLKLHYLKDIEENFVYEIKTRIFNFGFMALVVNNYRAK